MNILLVDLGSSYLPQLNDLLTEHTVRTVGRGQEHTQHIAWADIVILSGGHNRPANDRKYYRHELDLIDSFEGKILGICLGHQLLAVAHGGQLRRLPDKVRGLRTIRLSMTSSRFDQTSINVYKNHRWCVYSVPQHMIIGGRSMAGIEVLQHSYRPHVGMQFHPEKVLGSTAGRALFYEFLQ